MPSLTLTVLLVSLGAAPDPAPKSAPTPAEARAALTRGLPAVEKAGVRSLHHKCISCHNAGFLLWGHTAARDAGLAIDPKKFAEWSDGSLGLVRELELHYKLTPAAVEALRGDGVADDGIERLKPLVDKGFVSGADYWRALEQRLGADLLKRHGAQLLQRGRRSPPDSSLDAETAGQLLLGLGARPEGAIAKAVPELVSVIVRSQRPDGSWKAGARLPEQRRPRAEADAVTTLWSVLALASLEKPGAEAMQTRDKALAFLKNVQPGESNESLLLLMLVEKHFGKAERALEYRAELLKRQNADGGWAWRNGAASEAFGTGQALYALGGMGGMGGDKADPALPRAWRYLIDTQQKDGSWQVPYQAISTKNPKGNDARHLAEVYNFWGTTWATIGLARTLPR